MDEDNKIDGYWGPLEYVGKHIYSQHMSDRNTIIFCPDETVFIIPRLTNLPIIDIDNSSTACLITYEDGTKYLCRKYRNVKKVEELSYTLSKPTTPTKSARKI